MTSYATVWTSALGDLDENQFRLFDLCDTYAIGLQANCRWAHYILDSRSIWWDGARHLVPMLDLINCKELTDVNRVHSTFLDDSGLNAVTLAPDNFQSGDQAKHLSF